MTIKFNSNLDSPIGDVINQELQSADNVQIAVAFLKYSGIKIIENSLLQCLDSEGSFELIVGLDFKTTDPESIRYFMDLKNDYPKAKFHCFKGEQGTNLDIVFHPKIYLFEKRSEKTGIVGSSNLTRGGLISNFEVNIIFKEKETEPLYFPQLQAIYDSVTAFTPDEEFLGEYSDAYRVLSKNEDNATKDEGLQKIIRQIQERAEVLPGPVPTHKLLIVNAIRKKQEEGQEFVSLPDIYKEVEKQVAENENLHYKMDTLRNSIRGCLNTHEENSSSIGNMRLFIRSKESRGFYTLTENGKNYRRR